MKAWKQWILATLSIVWPKANNPRLGNRKPAAIYFNLGGLNAMNYI